MMKTASDTQRKSLIQQMKRMLCEGCTPLHIIKYLYDCSREEGKWQSFVTECFQQAFSVTMLALPDLYDTLVANREIRDYLNTEILHEIISNRPLWISEDADMEIASAWLGGLHTTDIWQTTEQFDPLAIPELAGVWPHLDDATRRYFRMLIVNSKVNYERSLILARLAEKLQETVTPST